MAVPSLAGIVLAAGKGTRMKSATPKCLHPVCGIPMVEHSLRALRGAGVAQPIVVIGHEGERIQAALTGGADFAWQREQQGTGHAVRMAVPLLENFEGVVLILPGDAPLVKSSTLVDLVDSHRASGASATVATVLRDDPKGYGRIIRDSDGSVKAIVEEKDADEATRTIQEVAVSVYAFDSRALFKSLPELTNENAQGEYYLTDLIELFRADGLKVIAHQCADFAEFAGVNDRWQLSEAEQAMRLRLLKAHALNGVTILNPETTFLGPDVVIGEDTIIESGTQIGGASKIGRGCRIGPGSSLESCLIGDDCKVLMSHLRRCELGDGVSVGPFANIRPHSLIGAGCKIGNFVEVKNATLEPKVSASHLSYIGDGRVGTGTNIGAGTITCNYDGVAKHRTEIGANVFVGSNSTLVAPLTIGDRAIVAAGSVVTTDVPADAGAFGRARTEIKEGWAAKWRQQKKEGQSPQVVNQPAESGA